MFLFLLKIKSGVRYRKLSLPRRLTDVRLGGGSRREVRARRSDLPALLGRPRAHGLGGVNHVAPAVRPERDQIHGALPVRARFAPRAHGGAKPAKALAAEPSAPHRGRARRN